MPELSRGVIVVLFGLNIPTTFKVSPLDESL